MYVKLFLEEVQIADQKQRQDAHSDGSERRHFKTDEEWTGVGEPLEYVILQVVKGRTY